MLTKHEDVVNVSHFYEFKNVSVAIVDTRSPKDNFTYYFSDENKHLRQTNEIQQLPINKKIIKLAYTGNHYMSVKKHPQPQSNHEIPLLNKIKNQSMKVQLKTYKDAEQQTDPEDLEDGGPRKK